MNAVAKTESDCKRELGLRLANFRRKLAHAINQRKITQSCFGELYGGYSGRAVASYELGDVDPPATLLYVLWQNGHSIDALFADGPIAESGRTNAIQLYEDSTGKLSTMDVKQRKRIYREVLNHAKKVGSEPSQETTSATSGKRKARHSTPRKTKKR